MYGGLLLVVVADGSTQHGIAGLVFNKTTARPVPRRSVTAPSTSSVTSRWV